MLYERTAIAKQPDEVIFHDLELLRNERRGLRRQSVWGNFEIVIIVEDIDD